MGIALVACLNYFYIHILGNLLFCKHSFLWWLLVNKNTKYLLILLFVYLIIYISHPKEAAMRSALFDCYERASVCGNHVSGIFACHSACGNLQNLIDTGNSFCSTESKRYELIEGNITKKPKSQSHGKNSFFGMKWGLFGRLWN